MKIFAVNTIVHREHQPVTFSIGDTLPEWAEGLVGDHCLEAPGEASGAPDDAETGAEAGSELAGTDDAEAQTESVTEKAAPAAVDFTKPARRNAAPKK